ncbi:hypothetical protein GOQ27_08175 [Clostridium sp. D2Q-11]|uniref:Uncharacterized protein n=1 Tax=Anaeromonas frigoriresistens TaxID=2683708 RepID=A0A942USK1_9FIRM|nr:hypothetical protein [Anaeromonas frigoriresistens]MBS4538439.1 hypothetical protein [Anaeromonas frigoriresistens]
MKSYNVELKKVSGGSGFASSMIRLNANTKQYINHILYVIDKNLFGDEHVLEYTIDEEKLNVDFHGKQIFTTILSEVEKFRSISANEFEKRIIKAIEAKGFNTDKENEYYMKVFNEG